MPGRLHKAAFVLPNAFTLASLFCGLFALSRALGDDADAGGLNSAALAILVGAFFDACDGRLARLTRTESELGIELDSLADVVTFGVAPAMLVYRFGLEALGIAGLLICSVWVAAGAFRLARFNVLARRAAARPVAKGERRRPSKYIIGLPIPPAAALLVSMVLAVQPAWQAAPVAATTALVACTLVLSFLMVSSIRFRSFKAVRWRSGRTIGLIFLMGAASTVVAMELPDAFVFVFLLALYVVLGVAETLLRRPPTPELELAGTAHPDL